MQVQLLSPGRPLAEVEAKSVSVPGAMGRMEILENHAVMVAEIDCGDLTIRKSSGEELHFFVSGGYVNVEPDTVMILVDVGESSDEIDPKRAQNALHRAKERLGSMQPDVNLSRALFAEKRAQRRMEVAGKGAGSSGTTN